MSDTPPAAPPASFIIRPPTASAWFFTVAALIAAGETYADLQAQQTKRVGTTLFGWPLDEGELTILLAVTLGAAALGAAYLGLAFLRPGRLCIDRAKREISWLRPRGPFSRSVHGAARDWRVRVQFFSQTERARGAFKRLELTAPGFGAVLLYRDVASPAALVEALEGYTAELDSFALSFDQPPPALNSVDER